MRTTFTKTTFTALGAFSLLILLAITPVAGSGGGSGSVSITPGQTVHIGETGLDLTAALNTVAGYGPVNTTPNYTTIGWWPGGESAGASAPAAVISLAARYSDLEISQPDFTGYLGNWYLLGPDWMTPVNTSMPLFRVAVNVDQGQVIHIDESGLDLRAALNSAAGNGPVYTTPDYEAVGWWPSGVPVGSSAPAKVINLNGRSSFLTVSGADFFGYFGDWYLLDASHMHPVNNSAPVFRVAVRVIQGQTIHLGETGLDVTNALNGAARNYPLLDPPANLLIGWWPDEASRFTSAPAQKIDLYGKYSGLTVEPYEFYGYFGDWYLVDPGTWHAVTTYGPVFRVAVKVNQGQTVHIGESGLDLTAALNGAAGNNPSLNPPTNLVIGWWPDEATRSTTAPAKTINLNGKHSCMTIAPVDFSGYFGDWYLVDPGTMHAITSHGPVFRLTSMVSRGQIVHISETNLDLTRALNDAAGNNPSLNPPTNLVIGWWPDEASRSTTAPAQKIHLDMRYSSFTVEPYEFYGYFGDWYLLESDGLTPITARGPVFRVATNVNQGQIVHLSETNLDLTRALNSAAGNNPSLNPPTNLVIGWWPDAASRSTTSPAKIINLNMRYSSFTVEPYEFYGYFGDWYVVDPGTLQAVTTYGPVFRVAVKVNQGQSVHIGETGLDLTAALNGAAGNNPALNPPTNLVIGWWPDEVSRSTTAPAKTINLNGMYSIFTVAADDFRDYPGAWYLVDPGTQHAVTTYGPVFRLTSMINRGQIVQLGETNLDLTRALNNAAGNNPSLNPPTYLVIGWWPDEALIPNSPPAKTVNLYGRYSSFTVTSSDFDGYSGDWYLVGTDGMIVANNNGPVFQVQ